MGPMSGSGRPGINSKREYERVSFLRKITVKVIKSNRFLKANCIDINIKGLRFFSEKQFSADEKIAIQIWLDNMSTTDPLWINARVVWSVIEQDGAITGVQFDNMIAADKHPKLYQVICGNQF